MKSLLFLVPPPYQITVGHMVEYDKKLFLSIQRVCKWHRGARKHLQTCLQASGTTPHDYLHYILYGFVRWRDQKKTRILGH